MPFVSLNCMISGQMVQRAMHKSKIPWKVYNVLPDVVLNMYVSGERKPYHIDGKPLRLIKTSASRRLEAIGTSMPGQPLLKRLYFVPERIYRLDDLADGQRYYAFWKNQPMASLEEPECEAQVFKYEGRLYDASLMPFRPHELSGSIAWERHMQKEIARHGRPENMLAQINRELEQIVELPAGHEIEQIRLFNLTSMKLEYLIRGISDADKFRLMQDITFIPPPAEAFFNDDVYFIHRLMPENQ